MNSDAEAGTPRATIGRPEVPMNLTDHFFDGLAGRARDLASDLINAAEVAAQAERAWTDRQDAREAAHAARAAEILGRLSAAARLIASELEEAVGDLIVRPPAPGDKPTAAGAIEALTDIHALLAGEAWNADTLQAVADRLAAAGFPVPDCAEYES